MGECVCIQACGEEYRVEDEQEDWEGDGKSASEAFLYNGQTHYDLLI